MTSVGFAESIKDAGGMEDIETAGGYRGEKRCIVSRMKMLFTRKCTNHCSIRRPITVRSRGTSSEADASRVHQRTVDASKGRGCIQRPRVHSCEMDASFSLVASG